MNAGAILAQFTRVLVLCAHTDDEFGCAGTILRLLAAGPRVRYLALSRCEESVPEGYPEDVLLHECIACTQHLGLSAEAVEVERFPVRHFPRLRQEILEQLVTVRKEYQPDLVLLPSSFDTHQDHATVFAEGFRAFKGASILGYELPQNLISFENSAFVALSQDNLTQKIAALSCYKSQGFRPYANKSFVESLARVRGVQAGVEFAEAFEVVRLLL